MSTTTAPTRSRPPADPAAPPLYPGDHMDRATFHALCEGMPDDFRAELIGGVVMVTPHVSAEHGGEHGLVATWLGVYHASTPGTRALSDATVFLGDDSQPRPDGLLMILPEYGGRTRYEGKYLAGPPELVVEVAYSSYAYDLYSKKRDYEKAGVREYVVLVLHQKRVEWFVLRDGAYQPQPPGEDGLYRSSAFPGLWLDPAAALGGDVAGVLQALGRGLESPEHAAFAAELSGRRRD